ncbi:MAG: hypothetical protein WCG25_01565 [bacterium]
MKTLFVVISLIFVALFSSCKKENVPVAHNRFVVVGNYTFEMISGPDEYQKIKIKIRNTNGEGFDYLEHFNDSEAFSNYHYAQAICGVTIPLHEISLPSERTIEILNSSGLIIYPQSKKITDNVKLDNIKDLSDITEDQLKEGMVFEYASNFFGIY